MTEVTLIGTIATELASRKIPCVLIGGFAVNFYKFSRQTDDIDFLIRDADINTIKPILETLGYKLFLETDAFSQFDGREKNLMDVDLMLVDRGTFDAIVKEGKKVMLSGVEILIPSLNHLIALKLHAIKNNPKRREAGDLLDIVRLIDIHQIDVTTDDFKNLCLKYGSTDAYEKIILFFKKK